jgi:hypothetical protein
MQILKQTERQKYRFQCVNKPKKKANQQKMTNKAFMALTAKFRAIMAATTSEQT